jgi:HEAT repeat protein
LLAGLAAGGCDKAQPTLAGGKPVSHWVEALKSKDPKERAKAVEKLGNAGNADGTVLPALLDALRDPDAHVRHAAVLALPKLGADSREALPVLTEMKQKDKDALVRDVAGKVIPRIEGAGP